MLIGEKMLCREVRSETEISREPRGTRNGHGQQQRCMYSVHLAVSQFTGSEAPVDGKTIILCSLKKEHTLVHH